MENSEKTQKNEKKSNGGNASIWAGTAIFVVAVVAVLFYVSQREHDLVTLILLIGVLLFGEIFTALQWFSSAKKSAEISAKKALIRELEIRFKAFSETQKSTFSDLAETNSEVRRKIENLDKTTTYIVSRLDEIDAGKVQVEISELEIERIANRAFEKISALQINQNPEIPVENCVPAAPKEKIAEENLEKSKEFSEENLALEEEIFDEESAENLEEIAENDVPEEEIFDEENDAEEEISDENFDETLEENSDENAVPEDEIFDDEIDEEVVPEDEEIEEKIEDEIVPEAAPEKVSDELPLMEDLPHTALILRAEFADGQRPFLRGNAPGISTEFSTPMEYSGNNRWRFDFGAMKNDANLTLYLNDTDEVLGEFVLPAGKVTQLAFEPQK